MFAIFLACIDHGKQILSQGDEWRLPGLGKFFCTELPPRVAIQDGMQARSLDAWAPLPDAKKKVRIKWSSFKSALRAVEDEDQE